MELVISKEIDGSVVVDSPDLAGSPAVGRAKNSIYKALGMWMINNQGRLKESGITISLDPSAQEFEQRRREKELAKR